MWGLASQAGAGVAIAGLTATYYALVRRNYQMEREAVHRESAIAITGQGDGQYNFDNKPNDTHLKSSQILLKKELQELSVLNGTSSGLNIIYHAAPYHRFQKSDFAVRPIISRVNTRPSTNFSDEEFDFENEEEGNNTSVSLFGSDPVIETVEKTTSISTSSQTDVDFSDNTQGESDMPVTTSEESVVQTLEIEQEVEESSASTLLSQASSKVVEKWKYVQDNMQLQRTNSPICFYKNPGFGNRYPFRMKEQPPKTLLGECLDVQLAPSSNSTEEKAQESNGDMNDNENDKETSSSSSSTSKQYKDSTLFLLSPVLSESNVSVCDREIQEKLSERSKSTGSDETVSEADDKSTLETVSDYNEILKKNAAVIHQGRGEGDTMPVIKLKQGPENCNLCPKSLPIPIEEEFQQSPSKDALEKEEEQDATEKVDEEAEDTPKDFDEDENIMPTFLQEEKPAEEVKLLDEETKSWEDASIPLEEVSNAPQLVPSISLVDELVNAQPSMRIRSTPPESVTVTPSISPQPRSSTGIPSDSWISMPVRVYFNSISTMPWSTIGLCIGVVIIAGFLGVILQRMAHEIVHPKNPR
ncbi:hypothetical protein Ocin01_13710 [Orchesella cincta]|uniref:Uncharacterized protein n=1 Tax=Orchesella cincta TaxID=48709 RepID=A0A1D2MJ85_ORCCI|nr:hypothetical protein Ocin01_13710 [Orchesella cincta]